MDLEELQWNWDQFGKTDPMWAIITRPDKKHNKWEAETFFQTGRSDIFDVITYVESLGIRLARGKAFDFGCGIGRITQALAEYFDDVCGVDIAPSMIEQAVKYNRFGPKCRYHLNETADLAFIPDESYDFVFTRLVLQHMEPIYMKGYIREFLRILAPAGVLIFQLPTNPTAEHLLKNGLLKRANETACERQPFMEMYCMEANDVNTLLTENGAKIVDVRPDDACGSAYDSFRWCVVKH